MALHQPHALSSYQQESNVIPLRSLLEVRTSASFGAFLRSLRVREQLGQAEVSDVFPEVFAYYHIATVTPDMYRKMENDIRAPQFEELLPLYAALRVKCAIPFSPEERWAYIQLARNKIESMLRRRPKPRADSAWDQLLNELVQVDQDSSPLVQDQKEANSRELLVKRETNSPLILDDVRHLVGREKWLEEMLSYRLAEVPQKIIVIQALTGTGKTSGLHLLLRHLVDRQAYHVLFFPFAAFATAATMTADECLDRLLAQVLSALEVIQPEGKLIARHRQMDMVLAALAASKKPVVLLLDDLHLVLEQNGELNEAWQQFLTAFVRREHQATIYIATREWPTLPGRIKSYLVETEMPSLSPRDGVKVWKRLGFVSVPDALLEQATTKLGGNAWMIELCARNLGRRRFTYSWQNNERSALQFAQKNERQVQIEQLLDERRVFDLKTDREAQLALEQVISRHLSHTALHLLEVLAMSAVAVPFALLEDVCVQAEEAFDELLHASFIDRDVMLSSSRVRLLTFVTEAAIQKLPEHRTREVEQHVIQMYTNWLRNGFHDEQEKAAVVTELAVLFLQHQRLLDAAQLLVRHGWLCFALGNGPRLARLAHEVMTTFPWQQEGGEQVCGGLLLYHYLGQYLGRKNNAQMRAEDYHVISDVAAANAIVLHPATQWQLLHHKILYLLNQRRFTEAQKLLDEALCQMESLHHTFPAIYASLLGEGGMLYGLWADHAKEVKDSEAERLRRDQAIRNYQQGIELLRTTEQVISDRDQQLFSVEDGEISFRLARLLNDMAHHLVCVGRSEEAISALQESIALKRRGLALPGSLAASLGELAQAYADLGHFSAAIASSEEALSAIQTLADTGNTIAYGERPVYLIDHARLLVRQLRLDEAESLLQQALEQGIREVRREYLVYAKETQREIDRYRASAHEFGRIYLDWRWYTRYRDAIAYDAFSWLSHAGPFTSEEQEEWTRLAQFSELNRESMMRLIKRSQVREIEAASSEQREPRLRYPAIPIDDVERRMQMLTQLKREIQDDEPRSREIERYEPNAVVRRLYSDAIEEQLNWLRLIASSYYGDGQAFWKYNQLLFAKPTGEEMGIALHHLKALLHRGLHYQKTRPISDQLSGYLRQWGLYQSQNWALRDEETEEVQEENQPPLSTLSTTHVDQRVVSSATVKKFFEAVLAEYEFDWSVLIDEAANNLRIENNINAIILPKGAMSVARVRELLSHEIECHVFRSEAGKRSKLGLLSLGTQGFLYTEEGLALYHDNKTAQFQAQGFEVGEATPSTWLGTLAVGLASGVLTSPHTFRELLAFFDVLYLLTRLLTVNNQEEVSAAQKHAHRMAVNRCLRTFRGVPDLASEASRGVCYTKDVVYLGGFRLISRAIEKDSTIHERLMIGVIAEDHLDALAELGMVLPATRPQWLAHRADLDEYILSFQ